MEGGASRRVRVLEGLDLVDEGIGLKSEVKSMDGAMVVGCGGLPISKIFRVVCRSV